MRQYIKQSSALTIRYSCLVAGLFISVAALAQPRPLSPLLQQRQVRLSPVLRQNLANSRALLAAR